MYVLGKAIPELLLGSTKEQMDAIADLQSAMHDMEHQILGFLHAIGLKNFCRVQLEKAQDGEFRNHLVAWRDIAFRDGAQRLSDFMHALGGANGRLRTACAAFNVKALRVSPSPDDLFHTYFPDVSLVRNNSAHTTLQTKNDKQRAEHAVSGEYGLPGVIIQSPNAVLIGCHSDDTYFGTWDNRVGRYDLNETSLDHLCEVKLAFLAKLPDDLIQDPSS